MTYKQKYKNGFYNISISANTPSQQAIQDFNKELAKLYYKYCENTVIPRVELPRPSLAS